MENGKEEIKKMIELKDNRLIFDFSNEVHEEAMFSIEFQRTLRLPDDNREYPLPPGFGKFPLFHVDDYGEKLPQAWNKHGGVFFPMYQAEAMWINFSGSYPFAVKIAAGKINAITGDAWTDDLNNNPQDYLVVPTQPWLDGFCIQKGLIRQFVAMPLGEGYTAEGQLTDNEEFGGIQIIAYPMNREVYKDYSFKELMLDSFECCKSIDMGLAPGGLMKQEIYEDKYSIDVWDTSYSSRCFVHLANSLNFKDTTGNNPPTKPPTAQDYEKAGLPWFDYYDKDTKALGGSKQLAELDSVGAAGIKKNQTPLDTNNPVSPTNIKTIDKNKDVVREGKF